jgi:hypothetical protein
MLLESTMYKLRRHKSNLQKPFLQKFPKLVFEPLTWIDTSAWHNHTGHCLLLVTINIHHSWIQVLLQQHLLSPWDVFKTLLHKHKYNVQQHFIIPIINFVHSTFTERTTYFPNISLFLSVCIVLSDINLQVNSSRFIKLRCFHYIKAVPIN